MREQWGKDEAEGVRRESLTQRACDWCLGVHIQRQVFIYMYYFHGGGEGGWGGLARSPAFPRTINSPRPSS